MKESCWTKTVSVGGILASPRHQFCSGLENDTQKVGPCPKMHGATVKPFIFQESSNNAKWPLWLLQLLFVQFWLRHPMFKDWKKHALKNKCKKSSFCNFDLGTREFTNPILYPNFNKSAVKKGAPWLFKCHFCVGILLPFSYYIRIMKSPIGIPNETKLRKNRMLTRVFFHYTGCLIGILIIAYYNPHITW